MARIEERKAKNRCIICSNDIEKSNLGSLCNPCKDKIYRYPAALKTSSRPVPMVKAEAKVR